MGATFKPRRGRRSHSADFKFTAKVGLGLQLLTRLKLAVSKGIQRHFEVEEVAGLRREGAVGRVAPIL